VAPDPPLAARGRARGNPGTREVGRPLAVRWLRTCHPPPTAAGRQCPGAESGPAAIPSAFCSRGGAPGAPRCRSDAACGTLPGAWRPGAGCRLAACGRCPARSHREQCCRIPDLSPAAPPQRGVSKNRALWRGKGCRSHAAAWPLDPAAR